jgi:UDP-N-acetylglucosamine 2-epimerase (non-hydrolysing)
MHILHVVGARPNFMKMAPVLQALTGRRSVSQTVVHSGQHFDANMSEVFFEQLGIPAPDLNLGVGPGSHAAQTCEIMKRLEGVLLQSKPDLVLVYGDVNTTLAAALVCSKLLIEFAHVEAGLRSFDRTMPEEINRVVTDQLASVLFTPSADANQNLEREGVAKERIRLVGNVMIDTLVRLLPKASSTGLKNIPARHLLVTLHRPSNVDDGMRLKEILGALAELSRLIPVVFPVHPRTRARMASLELDSRPGNRLLLQEPVGYLEFLGLQRSAAVVVTDSGGIQEETTFLGVPCLTLRENTERPITVTMGTNKLVGHEMAALQREVRAVLEGRAKKGSVPPLWDGRAAERIAAAIA